MALTLDSSTPAQVDKTTAGSTATTGSFTAPANALLLAWFESDEGGQINSTIADTGGLTWTRLARICANTVGEANTPAPTGTAQDGYVSVWSATTASSTSRTVTVTVTGAGGINREAMFSVMVYTDSGGAPTTGAVASKGGSASAPSHAITTTAADSWVWAGISDWSAAGAGTAGSGQTLQHDHAGTNVSAHLVKQNATTPGSGSSVTMNLTAPASQTWNEVVVEVLANGAAAGPAGPGGTRPGRTWLRRFRNRQLLPSAPAAPTPPVTTQDLPPQVPARDRVFWLARAKPRRAEPPLAPAVVVTVQALPPQTPTRVRTLPWRRRARFTTVTTVTTRPLPLQPVRDRAIPVSRRRAYAAAPPPAPVVTVTTQALPPQPATRDRVFWLPRAKPRQAQPVPAQVVVVTVQALPPQPGRRRWGFLPRARARQAQPVPAQVVVQTVQALPPQPARKRFGFLPRAKARAAIPVPPPVVVVTAQALPPQPGRRRFAFWPKATARTAQPVRPQVIVVITQALPVQPGRRRLRFLPRPRRGLATQLFRVYVIGPNDGVPVDNPGLVLTSPTAGLPLSSPIAGMFLTSPIAAMGLTSPVARLELVMATFYTGDTSPDLTGTCTSNGVAANITGAILALHLKKPDGTIVTKTGTIVSGPAGTWSYSWIAGDLNLSGPWSVEVQVTYSGGKIQTFGPSAFAVVEQFA